jgi:putative FmdB family regulatory protein
MPIYAYRCATCGHAKDVLQKMSDPLLTVCPSCGAATFVKQVTAAGFQLKGSGWYVTDFRGGDAPPAKPVEGGAKTDAVTTDATPAPAVPAPAAKSDAAPAPVAAPAAPATPSGTK